MLSILLAGGVALTVTLLGTPLFIRFLVAKQYGQFIRQDGPTSHQIKRGTPTMGGVMIILGTVLGYAFGNGVTGRPPDVSGLLLLFLIGITFAVLALRFRNNQNRAPASTRISVLRDSGLDLAFAGTALGLVLFIAWANFLITAWSNAVNLTDGLDGLATGASMFAFGAYTVITMWQSNQSCVGVLSAAPGCYNVRDPRDLAIACAALVGACFGFLWWNTSPARIFMGDTGSLALGGAFAGLSILTHTEVLAVLLGGLFVIEVTSDVIQIGFFKATRRRIFRMAPLHHHFELEGWKEVTVVVRFWIIQALLMCAGLGLFYAEWVAKQ